MRYSAEEDRYLRRAWPGGEPVEVIAERLGRSESSVRQRANALGLYRTGEALHSIRSRARETKLTEVDRYAIRRLVKGIGATQIDVARVYGLNPQTVHRIVAGRRRT